MNYGGYCWVNGVTYEGNRKTLYDVTYVTSERAINYNAGEINDAYNNLDDDGDPNLPIDLRKNTGRIIETVTKQTGFYIDTENAVLSTANASADINNKFHLDFSEDTRTHIDLIISRSKEAPYYYSSLIG